MSYEIRRSGKRSRKQLTFSDTYGVLDNIREYDFDLVSFYVTFTQFIDRSLYKQGANRLIFKNNPALYKAFNISNNKFYRLLRKAYECGLVDIKKGASNKNIYVLNDDIPLEPLKKYREWENRFDANEEFEEDTQSSQNATTENEPSQSAMTQTATSQFATTYNSSNIYNNSNIYKSVYQSEEDKSISNNESEIDKIELNKFNQIIKNCELHLLDKSKRVSIEKALRLLYFSDKRLQIGDNYIPREMVRKDMKRITLPVIEYALKKFENACRTRQISSTMGYLKVCIYNSIAEMDLDIESELLHKGIL
ncbi:hypothetical protein [Sporosalibacterium faouarense]|uniref:hypothetical protein n=1 Tax=Sporosalibacterium faouarense TaxID=516123 RepID=UPI00192B311B|nr:hypothetical protein [Sporosalibacterium faouarense]